MNLFSIYPSFSPLVPRLKYIMVQLMMKGWLCPSGSRGEENEGGIAEVFCSATGRSLQRGERLEKVLYSVCAWTHTSSHFHSTLMQNALKHVPALQHFNNTNTLKFNFHSESFSVRWLHPVGKCHISECCRYCWVFSSPVWIQQDQTVWELILRELLLWRKHTSHLVFDFWQNF